MTRYEEFPKEHYIELNGSPYHIGRIALTKMKSQFLAEIDIVHKESHKIYHHVDSFFSHDNEDEVVGMAVQKLSIFLKSPH